MAAALSQPSYELPALDCTSCTPANDMESAGAYAEARRRADAIGPIANPVAFGWMIEPVTSRERQEVAWATMLDTHGYLRRIREVARGQVDRVMVPIPFALRAAIDAASRYLILAHNHPSGYAWPSEADAELTSAMSRAAHEVDLVLLDHVVLGRGEVFSFREQKLWRIK
jgi:DNA repair protein RadC